jgi:hypothetical protein
VGLDVPNPFPWDAFAEGSPPIHKLEQQNAKAPVIGRSPMKMRSGQHLWRHILLGPALCGTSQV